MQIPEDVQALIATIEPDRWYSTTEYGALFGKKPSAVHSERWRGKASDFVCMNGRWRIAGRSIIRKILDSLRAPPKQRTQPRTGEGRFARAQAA